MISPTIEQALRNTPDADLRIIRLSLKQQIKDCTPFYNDLRIFRALGNKLSLDDLSLTELERLSIEVPDGTIAYLFGVYKDIITKLRKRYGINCFQTWVGKTQYGGDTYPFVINIERPSQPKVREHTVYPPKRLQLGRNKTNEVAVVYCPLTCRNGNNQIVSIEVCMECEFFVELGHKDAVLCTGQRPKEDDCSFK